MRRILFIVAAVLLTVTVSAQTKVKGVVLDSLTRVGEPAAVVQFFHEDSPEQVLAYTVTESDGHFSKEFEGEGKYEVRVTNMGRKPVSVVFQMDGQEELDLGELLISDDIQTLKAGSVTAQKTLVVMDIDKITYKVEDDVDAKTSTILDMLRKVPMVSVDGQDNITVNGSSSFQVYIDGKLNPMISSNPSQILKLMPASLVKNIEVMTNPGAKYDAEGVGGVLNITTNLSQTGGASVADGQYANVTLQGSTKGYGGGLYYSRQKGKWTFSINGNASRTDTDGTSLIMERIQKMEGGDFVTTTSGEADVRTPLYLGNMSLSYEIDSLNLISATAGYMGSAILYNSVFTTGFESPFMDYSYGGKILTKTSSNSLTANVDYQRTWAGMPSRSLVLSYQFSGTPSDNAVTNVFDKPESMGLVDRRADGFTNSLSNTVQADFSTPVGSSSSHTLNLGTKFTARHNLSDQSNFIYDGADYISTPEGSLEYDFYNNIGALYAEYDGKFGPFGVKAGARYEHTWQNVTYAEGQGKGFSLDYGNLVPVASIQYNISQLQNIGLSYNVRISRPGITYLNPYVDNITDPTSKTYGNPDLKAEKGHTVSAVYNFFSTKWIVSMTLRQGFTGDGISQYSFYDNESVLNTTYGNVVSTSTTGLNAFVTWIPGQKTRVIFNGEGSYTDIRSKTLDQSNSGWTWTSLLGLQQTLPWDLRLSANAIGSGRTISLQGWTSGMLVGTIGLTKSFLEDRLSLSLSGLSHLTGGRGLTIDTFSQGKDFVNCASTTIPLRMVTFNLSFSFGRQDNASVKKTRKTIEQDVQLNSKSTSESIGTVMQM